VAGPKVIKEEKGTHSTVTCSRCGKTFDADHKDPSSDPCVGPPGTSHDLHGNRELVEPDED
jgi:hypothetical protein